MPVLSVTTDPEALTLTATAEYPVPVERLWAAWADPRQLERFWGPPQWPSTFTRHELKVGGRSEYEMTGPNGESSKGYWVFEEVVPHEVFRVRDGFRHEDGSDNDDLPGTTMELRFESIPGGSRFTSVSRFGSAEALEQLVAMGMVEGLKAAMAQIDAVVTELRELSRDFGTHLEVLDDTHVRVTRDVAGRIDQVWRAHHEAALVKRWMLGPEGWTMPVCEVATVVGETFRYEWESAEDGSRFGFTGELLESEAPRRSVTTEHLIGMEGPGTVNELVLTPRAGGRTAIALTITYPSKELRDQVLATGMVHGMESSYARLERVIA